MSEHQTSFAGKTVLVVGGTRGIGLATAQLFMRRGARVAVTGTSEAALAEARQALGPQALVLRSDGADLGDIAALMRRVGEEFGHLDVLFLNAARIVHGTVHTLKPADFDAVIDLNLKGTFFTLQAALPLMAAGGAVVVTTSISNRVASPNNAVYAASKAALRSLVQAWAVELAPQRIRVNAVCPGPVDTAMFDQGLTPEQSAQRKAAIAARSPLRRMGTDEDLANAVLFLAGEESAYVLGHELVVDGCISLVRPVG